AVKLRNFYFQGIASIPKVVSIDNYGRTGGQGQVRINIFRQSPWHLREFKLQTLPSCTIRPCDLTFVPVTDKTNPAPILFGPAAGAQAALIEAFQNDFISQVPSLADCDINRFTFNMADTYNIGQSDSQTGDVYGVRPFAATSDFKNRIQAAIPSGST